MHPRGFGFLRLFPRPGEPLPESVFVAPRELQAFFAGDLVEATLVEEPDGRHRAERLELRERWREALCGKVTKLRGKLHLEVDPRVGNRSIPLEGAPQGLAPGAHVVGRLREGRLEYFRTVAPDEVGRAAVLVNWGIRSKFSAACEEAAEAAEAAPGERRDLRAIPTVTIDAASSRDLDDALAALPAQADGAVRVLVSIADVDALVPAGSPIDREAQRRGTSVYLPGEVIPMLPRRLSEERLSLLEGVDRPALTVELRIDPEGGVRAVDLYQSTIRNHARLTYDAAAAFLERGEAAAVPAAVHGTLRWLRTAAARLSEVRARRGGVDLERGELALELDEAGQPVGVHPREENAANRLIERLMVAANEAVATWLRDRGLPALYRVQDAPDAAHVARFAEVARNFGFEAGFGERVSPRALAAFDQQLGKSEVAPQVRTVLGRELLGRARYTVHPGLHFALGAPLYLHFTSPIRRYPDLVVHRIVKAHLRGDRTQVAGDARLEAIAEACNELAYRAGKAEQERTNCLLARLLGQRLGEPFAARVVGVRPFGLMVQLVGTGVPGTVPVDALPGGPFEFDDTTVTLVGPGGKRWSAGDALEVEVAEVDEVLGRIDFKPRAAKARAARGRAQPAEAAPSGEEAPARRKPRRRRRAPKKA